MLRLLIRLALVLSVCHSPGTRVSRAQQVTITVPQQNISGGWYEFIGGRWVYFGPGFAFNFGGQPTPPFGGFDPNAGLSTGFAFGGGGAGGQLNFNAATGYSNTFTSTTPMLTVTNGVPGSIFIGRTRPFVAGLAPVVPTSPLLNPAFNNLGAANSIAGRIQRGEMHIRNGRVMRGPDPRLQLPPDLAAGPNLFAPLPAVAAQVDDDRALQPRQISRRGNTDEDKSAAGSLWSKAQQLESEGKPGAARLLYQTALRQADGEMRDRIQQRLDALD